MSDESFHSLQGCFLVAGRHLRDPNFFRTVVLILSHSEEGAMALVINRPSAMTIGKALSQNGPVNDADAPVFVGGPVEPTALFIVHNCTKLAGDDREIAPGVFLAGSDLSFEAVVRSPAKEPVQQSFRLLSGYAGWSNGQLESELARGDWHILKADAGLVFEDDPYGVWEVCMRRIQRRTRPANSVVKNPELN